MASALAAEQAGTRAETLRGLVYRAIHACPSTDKELQARLGLDGSTQRPRRIELLRAGLIEDAGQKRAGATVWRAR